MDEITWFKVDDGFWSHEKVIGLSPDAGWLWTRAGAYCAQHLTDGRVPVGVLRMLGADEDAASELAAAGLWDKTPAGWQFHDWCEYQPTREKVLADRAGNARRQELSRNKDLRDEIRKRDDERCRYCGVEVKWSDRKGSLGGTYDHVDPEGPNTADNLVVACRGCNSRKSDRTPAGAGMPLLPPPRFDLVTDQAPSRPVPSPSSTKKSVRKPETRLPDDWTPNETHVRIAVEAGVDGRREEAQFRDHAAANDRRQRDWDAAFRTWLRNARPVKATPMEKARRTVMLATELVGELES